MQKTPTGYHFNFDVYWCVGADRKVLCLGIIQSLFEGSMYTFVLEWTPALTPAPPPPYPRYRDNLETSERVGGHHALSTQAADVDDMDDDGHRGAIPHGFIFAAFMVPLSFAVLTFQHIYVSMYRVTDHTSWKVMEFSKTIFQAWKVMENSQGHGKS